MVLISLPELPKLKGFQWDEGNRHKNRLKHQINTKECEQIFFNRPIIIFFDRKHSQQENRYGVLGITNQGRLISLVFTIRSQLVRVITARSQSRKEKSLFRAEQI
jgi:uncharacterized DUF497 family protein